MLNREFLFSAAIVAGALLSSYLMIYALSISREQNREFKIKCGEKNGIVYNVKGGHMCMKQDSVIIVE